MREQTIERVKKMEEVTIYTDGACSGNPGPGGWGCVLLYTHYNHHNFP